MANDNARFAAILLAVAFPVAVWIGADYLTQQEMEDPNGSAGDPRAIARAAGAPRSATPAPPLAPRPPEIRREHGIEQALAAQPPVVTTGTIHKCRVQGQIVYSDQPCSAGTDLNSFAPSLAAVPVVATSRSVVPPSRPAMQAQPVGQSQPVEQVAAGDVAEIEKAQREAECRKIDEQIVSIDARMRQPYYASEGDWLKERRKALNDRRFSLGC